MRCLKKEMLNPHSKGPIVVIEIMTFLETVCTRDFLSLPNLGIAQIYHFILTSQMLNLKLSVIDESGIMGVIETRIWGIWGQYLPWDNLASVKSHSDGTNNSGDVCETRKTIVVYLHATTIKA